MEGTLKQSTVRATVACFLAIFILGSVFPSAMGLQCYQCGQYNDGVGSITPCINLTKFHLKECPSNLNNYCIKYVSEGSVVRDCIDKCVERETWGTRYYCCNEDGCNSSETLSLSLTAWISSIALLTLRQIASF